METIELEIKSAMPAVMARVKAEALDQMERQALNIAVQVASDEARKWAVEVLAPEIRAQLEAGKEGMLSKAQDIAGQLADGIGDALVAEMKKNLAQSWNVRKISDALFG